MEGVTATVTSLSKGSRGPFAIATSKAMTGSITFSLRPPVWRERRQPEPGDIVYLSDLREKRGGWRALKSELTSPGGEE